MIPLSTLAGSVIGSTELPLADLRMWEIEEARKVFLDLKASVESLQADRRGRTFLSYRSRELSSAFRKPDDAVTGFPRQALAFRIASMVLNGGPYEVWAADEFQVAGLNAAFELVNESSRFRAVTAAKDTPAVVLEAPPRHKERRAAKSCDVLYLALEPHVALQQDRILSLLSERYDVAAVALSRTLLPWPSSAHFVPASHTRLRSYLKPEDLLAQGVAAGLRLLRGSPARSKMAWMSRPRYKGWLRRTWLRAANVTDALSGAIETHRPKLLLGTNLASGIGAVMSECARSAGVPVLSLPSGGDYLVPPQFDPVDMGSTNFVLPGEGIADLLRSAGAPGSQLFACGWPEMDALNPMETIGKTEARATLGLDSQSSLGVFFSSPSTEADQLVIPSGLKERAFRSFAQACRDVGLQCAVKLHPRETDGLIEKAAAACHPPVPVFKDRLPLLLHASDAVGSLGSAVSFAAAVLGKTTLILEAQSIGRTAEVFERLSIGLQPNSPEELRLFLKDAIGASTSLVGHGFQGADGRVAERVGAVVDSLIAGR